MSKNFHQKFKKKIAISIKIIYTKFCLWFFFSCGKNLETRIILPSLEESLKV